MPLKLYFLLLNFLFLPQVLISLTVYNDIDNTGWKLMPVKSSNAGSTKYCYEICSDETNWDISKFVLGVPECCLQDSGNIEVDYVNDMKTSINDIYDSSDISLTTDSDKFSNIYGWNVATKIGPNECSTFCLEHENDLHIQHTNVPVSISGANGVYIGSVNGPDTCLCGENSDSDSRYMQKFIIVDEIPADNMCTSMTDGCASCAMHMECKYCNNECIHMKQECPNNEYLCEEEQECPDYEPVRMVGFTENERLTYQMFVKSCSVFSGNSSNGTNETTCNTEVEETTFWVIKSDNYRQNYQLFGRLNGIGNVTENDYENIQWSVYLEGDIPVCEVYVKASFVRNLTCPYLDENSTLDGSVSDTLISYQPDALLSTLKFLLPRLDTKLYDRDEDICEEDPNGIVRSHRSYSGNDTNTTVISKTHDMSLYDSWDTSIKPDNLTSNETTTINNTDNKIQEVNLGQILDFSVQHKNDSRNDTNLTSRLTYDIKIDLKLIDVQILSNPDTVFNDLLQLLYNWQNGTYVVYITNKEWRKQRLSDPQDTNNEDNIINNGETHVNIGQAFRRRALDSISDGIGFYDYNRKLFDTEMFGVDIAGGIESSFGWNFGWTPKSNLQPVKPNGCSSLLGWVAGWCDKYEDKIDACCDTHDKEYASCDTKKSDADKKLEKCIKDISSSNLCIKAAAAAMDVGLDLGVDLDVLHDIISLNLPKLKISDFYYILAKMHNCKFSLSESTPNIKALLYLNLFNRRVFDIGFDGNSDIIKEDKRDNNGIIIEKSNKFCNWFYRFEICIPIIWGIEICGEFKVYAKCGLEFDTKNDINGNTQSFTFELAPYFEVGVEASLSISLLIIRAGVGIQGQFLKTAVPLQMQIIIPGNSITDKISNLPKNGNIRFSILTTFQPLKLEGGVFYQYRTIKIKKKCFLFFCIPWLSFDWSSKKWIWKTTIVESKTYSRIWWQAQLRKSARSGSDLWNLDILIKYNNILSSIVNNVDNILYNKFINIENLNIEFLKCLNLNLYSVEFVDIAIEKGADNNQIFLAVKVSLYDEYSKQWIIDRLSNSSDVIRIDNCLSQKVNYTVEGNVLSLDGSYEPVGIFTGNEDYLNSTDLRTKYCNCENNNLKCLTLQNEGDPGNIEILDSEYNTIVETFMNKQETIDICSSETNGLSDIIYIKDRNNSYIPFFTNCQQELLLIGSLVDDLATSDLLLSIQSFEYSCNLLNHITFLSHNNLWLVGNQYATIPRHTTSHYQTGWLSEPCIYPPAKKFSFTLKITEKITHSSHDNWYIGIMDTICIESIDNIGYEYLGHNDLCQNSWGYYSYNGKAYHQNSGYTYASPWMIKGVIIKTLVDFELGLLGFWINGNFQGWAFKDLDLRSDKFYIPARFPKGITGAFSQHYLDSSTIQLLEFVCE